MNYISNSKEKKIWFLYQWKVFFSRVCLPHRLNVELEQKKKHKTQNTKIRKVRDTTKDQSIFWYFPYKNIKNNI